MMKAGRRRRDSMSRRADDRTPWSCRGWTVPIDRLARTDAIGTGADVCPTASSGSATTTSTTSSSSSTAGESRGSTRSVRGARRRRHYHIRHHRRSGCRRFLPVSRPTSCRRHLRSSRPRARPRGNVDAGLALPDPAVGQIPSTSGGGRRRSGR